MPNHCYQQVHLRGPSHLIQHLHHSFIEIRSRVLQHDCAYAV